MSSFRGIKGLLGGPTGQPFSSRAALTGIGFVIEKIGNGELTEGNACIMAIKHKMKKIKLLLVE